MPIFVSRPPTLASRAEGSLLTFSAPELVPGSDMMLLCSSASVVYSEKGPTEEMLSDEVMLAAKSDL